MRVIGHLLFPLDGYNTMYVHQVKVPTPSGTSECADVRDFHPKFGEAAHFAPGNKIQLASRNSCKFPVYNHYWLDFMHLPLQMTDVDSILPAVLCSR